MLSPADRVQQRDSCPSPCEGRGRRGGGAHGSRGSRRHPSPTLPCLRRRGSQKLAAEAAPAGVRGQSQGEFEIVDQAGAAPPRGDEGAAPTRAVFRLVQVTIPPARILNPEARPLQRPTRLRLHTPPPTPALRGP